MSNELIVGIVGFFALVVSAMTAVVGYFKVYRQSDGNGRKQSLGEWLRQLQDRCKYLEDRLEKTEARAKKCEEDRHSLQRQILELLEENRSLRVGGTGEFNAVK